MNCNSSRADDVGILAIEVYFPSQYVDQAELEQYDGVSAGKYTIGLGQSRMGFCTDLEDVNSLCLTVTRNLMERHDIKPSDIGRLEVGTETLVDKSKSVKSVLMQLFSGHGDIEGVDSTNACYGGTAALFNAVNWLESRSWDGRRLALVVCADIAVYAAGGARPTGGAGAVAMLLGPDAPLVLQPGLRASHMRHVYDFYKPDLTSEYPVVDGKLSIQCYLSALDHCYQLYRQKAASANGESVSLDSFDSVIFHCPYGKLVQKSFARLMLNDFLTAARDDNVKALSRYPEQVHQFQHRQLEETYFERDVEKAFMTASQAQFDVKTRPSLLLAANVGNMYTPSVYSCLVSLLLSKSVDELSCSRVCVFSYGSGLASSMYSIRCNRDNHSSFKLSSLVESVGDVRERLEKRSKVSPQQFVDFLQQRQAGLHKVPMVPLNTPSLLFDHTYYLSEIDQSHRRHYHRC